MHGTWKLTLFVFHVCRLYSRKKISSIIEELLALSESYVSKRYGISKVKKNRVQPSHQGKGSKPGRSGPMKRSSSGSRPDRPNLTAIGQKLRLVVSITSVTNEAGNNRSGNLEQSVKEVVNIKVEKEEPAETKPIVINEHAKNIDFYN